MRNPAAILAARLGEHLETRKPPRLPEGCAVFWRWFLDLHRTRRWTIAGPSAITYAEMEVYFRLMRVPAQPRHIDIVVAMDRAFLDHWRASRDRADGRPVISTISAQPVTAAAFDAVFGR